MNAQSLFHHLEPWKVLHGLGIRPENGEVLHPFTDPAWPKHQFAIFGKCILELQGSGKFVAGSVVDYLAHRNSAGYAEAVKHILQTENTNLTRVSNSTPMYYEAQFVDELKAARRRFWEFRGMSEALLTSPELSICCAWLRGHNISPDVVRPVIFGAMGHTLNRTTTGNFNDDSPYLMFMYMRNPWTYAGFEYIDVSRGTTGYLELESSEHAYFGMPNGFAVAGFVHDNTVKAAQSISESFSTQSLEAGNVVIRHDSRGVANDYLIPVGRMHYRTNLQDALKHRKAFGQMTIETPDGRYIELMQYAVTELARELQTDAKDLPRIRPLIDFIREDHSLAKMIEDELLRHGRQDCIAVLRRLMNQIAVFTHAGLQLQETPEGYVVRKGSSRQLVSNFTLKFTHSVGYPNSGELWHVGTVVFKGQSYPISVPRKYVLNFKQLEAAVVQAVTRQTINGQVNPESPAFWAESYRSIFTAYVRFASARVRMVQGVEQLGWSNGKTEFVTPTWSVSSSGVTPTSRIRHALLQEFDFTFDFAAGPPQPAEGLKPSKSLWTCVAALVGGIVRSYMRAPIGVTAVSMDEHSVKLLQYCLAGMGQTRPYEINQNRRTAGKTSLHGISGFPMLISSPADHPTDTLEEPFLVLRPDGFLFASSDPQHELQHASWLTQQVVQELTQNVIRTGAAGHHLLTDKVPTLSQLVREGREAIQLFTSFGRVNISETLTSKFANFLLKIPEEQINHVFTMDLETQRATFHCRRAKAKRGDLIDELRDLGADPQFIDGGKYDMTVDLKKLTEILSEFYGKQVALQPDVSPTDQALEQ